VLNHRWFNFIGSKSYSKRETPVPKNVIPMSNVQINIPGLIIAGKSYGNPKSTKKILCSHGWMDNCASFDLIAPYLVEALDAHLIAIDLPGHGLSSHRSTGHFYITVEYAANIVEVINELQWEKTILIGHSLSGGLLSIVSGSFPEKISACILIEGIGGSNQIIADAASAFKRAFSSHVLNSSMQPTRCSSLEEAVSLRHRNASLLGNGKQTLSLAAATALVKRGTKVTEDGVGVEFTHDKRIASPSLIYPSEASIQQFLEGITCPVLLITGKEGWPDDVYSKRLQFVKSLKHVKLPGSHHLHMDPDTYEQVLSEIVTFLRHSYHP
jgi:pimeloyl-ACP methyl ester carboxylesterase